MSTQRSSASDLGTGLITALAQRDFPRLAKTLTPEVRMRALIPPGPIEVSGAEAAAAKFASWFADAEELELIRSGRDTVADRLHLFYRLRVKRPATSGRSSSSTCSAHSTMAESPLSIWSAQVSVPMTPERSRGRSTERDRHGMDAAGERPSLRPIA